MYVSYKEVLQYQRAHNSMILWTALLVLWSYLNFMWEILIIVNAAVKGSTFFHAWSAHYLKPIQIPYTGIWGTVYGTIYPVFSQQAARKERKFAKYTFKKNAMIFSSF